MTCHRPWRRAACLTYPDPYIGCNTHTRTPACLHVAAQELQWVRREDVASLGLMMGTHTRLAGIIVNARPPPTLWSRLFGGRHWLCIRRAADGSWHNFDSMLPAPRAYAGGRAQLVGELSEAVHDPAQDAMVFLVHDQHATERA